MTRTIYGMDGFDYITDISNLRYSGVSGGTVVTGRNGGQSVQFTGSGSGFNFPFLFPINIGDRIIFGFAFKITSASINLVLGTLFDGGTNNHIDYRMGAGGSFTATVNGVLAGTSVTTFTNNVWYYLEFDQIINNSGGEIHCRSNGVTEEFSVTGIDTQSSGTGIIEYIFLGGNTGRTIQFDDVYLRYASADETAKTSYLGDVSVTSLFPTGAGTTTQFTPSTGSNYQNVDDADPDDDSTYNSSSTVGNIDTFALADLASTGTVYAVQSLISAKKTDAGSRSLASVYRIGGVNYVGTDKSISEDYSYLPELKETSPASAAAWTTSEINAMEAGYKITV